MNEVLRDEKQRPLSIKAGRVSLLLLLAIGFLLGLTSRAEATTEFHKIFVSEYLKDHPDKKFAKFAKRKANATFVHVGRKKQTRKCLWQAPSQAA